MKTHHFLAWALSQPWALMPERIRAYSIVLARSYGMRDGLIAAGGLGEDDHGAALKPSAGPRAGNGRQGAIAVIPIIGTIVQRASQIDICEGGTSTQQVSAALRSALADETIAQILLDIDSPGGSVFGVAELADEIRAARSSKPIVAIANSLAASAAYWIGSAASEFYVTPSGMVGSIGVWTAHEDWSKALEDAGINVTLISAGKYKVEGNPYGPIDGEALAYQQSSVDEYYKAFTQAVAKGRGVPVDAVRSGMGQGRVLQADAALAEKMVDGIEPFDAVVKRMMRSQQQASRGRSALMARRRAMDLAA